MLKSEYTVLRSRASALWLCLLFLYILLLPTTAETGTSSELRDGFTVSARYGIVSVPAGGDQHP